MRLILIDNHSGFIFGDTANYRLGRLEEWRDNNSDSNSEIRSLSVLAARLVDDSIGERGREYEFVTYDPGDARTGYFIYRADVDGSEEAAPVVADGQKQETIDAVRRDCRFEGFVECRRG